MTQSPPHDCEEVAYFCWERGDYKGAFEVAWESLRPEMTRFLASELEQRQEVEEVLCAFGEQLWRSMPAFRWESLLRTWAYRLLKNVLYQFRRSPTRRELPAGHSSYSEIANGERSETDPWLRTDVKRGFAAIRDGLDPDDRYMLQLRVDLGMRWNEIAQVMGDEPLRGDALQRRSVALRQRFLRVKEQLRSMAAEMGLIERE